MLPVVRVDVSFSNLKLEVTYSNIYDRVGWCLVEVHRMKNKHLILSDRIMIEQSLNIRCSFRFSNKQSCRKKLCWSCATTSCTTVCEDFEKSTCTQLSKPPYVCNGCETRRKCTLEKRLYSASYAQKEYESICSESRQGIQLSEEALIIDSIISPLLTKGQSLHHICINHLDEIMCDERTLYNYVNHGIFSALKLIKNAVLVVLTMTSLSSVKNIHIYQLYKWILWKAQKAERYC